MLMVAVRQDGPLGLASLLALDSLGKEGERRTEQQCTVDVFNSYRVRRVFLVVTRGARRPDRQRRDHSGRGRRGGTWVPQTRVSRRKGRPSCGRDRYRIRRRYRASRIPTEGQRLHAGTVNCNTWLWNSNTTLNRGKLQMLLDLARDRRMDVSSLTDVIGRT